MADKRISQLNPHTSPSGSDLFVVVNNNETKKITYADLIDGIASDNTAINNFTASYLIDSASFDNRVDSLESWSSSLDTTFATDLQVSIVSSSVAATIGVISQQTGLVTTSSFNQYTSSQTILNNTFATTGSNVFRGSQTISGSLNVMIPGGTATGINENPNSNNIFWSYIPQDTNTTNIEVGWNAIADNFGSYIVTDVQYNGPFVYITLNDDVSLPYRIRLNFSKPSHLWQFNEDGAIEFPDNTLQTTAFTGIPTGSISSSQQITDLGFATTGSNTFRGSQTVNGFVSASYYRGSGRNLTNLTPITNWNYEQEFSVKNTEQLTFSGDYILENTYLAVNGGDDEIEYSSNKSFIKEGSIFIGGNLLVKDSYIENDGLISVGGEVILIGNSQITGTGKII